MSVVTVCKNVIQKNNKRKWENPEPPIRIAKSRSGKAIDHVFEIGILDREGRIVARLQTTPDGRPIVKCGAKVMLSTKYPVRTYTPRVAQ